MSVARLEDLPLVTGRGNFAGDVSFPHQLHMRVVRSPYAHGHLKVIDVAEVTGRHRGMDSRRYRRFIAHRFSRRPQ